MKKLQKARKLLYWAVSFTLRMLRSPWGVFLLGATIGVISFCSLYGTKVLDPTFVAWLMPDSDIKQHYIGWEYFRHEPWSFPLGAIHSLAYPFGISLTYTDSIPLIAIPVKLFASVLPDQFQYFGLWGMLGFILQGGIAALIARRFSKGVLFIILVATIFVVCPPLLARTFVHTALASQWLLLAAIWAMMAYKRPGSVKRQVTIWSLLFVLAATIHPYFLPMIALPFVIFLALTHHHAIETVVKGAVPLVAATTVFWIVGGFAVSASDSVAGGLGEYALNLTSLYNPLGWSPFLPALSNHSLSGETLAYLGLGMILLVPVVFFGLMKDLDSRRKIQAVVAKFSWRYFLSALAVAAVVILALSPRIQFGTAIVLDVQLPYIVERIWSIFRSSARLFWVVYYMILVGIVWFVARSFRRTAPIFAVLFFLPFAALQVWDIRSSPQAELIRQRFARISNDSYAYRPLLHLDEWSTYAQGKRHFVYLDKEMGVHDFFAFVDVTSRFHLTMNMGYFARAPYEKIQEYREGRIELLKKGQADTDSNLYVTKSKDLAQSLQAAGRTVSGLDGVYLITG